MAKRLIEMPISGETDTHSLGLAIFNTYREAMEQESRQEDHDSPEPIEVHLTAMGMHCIEKCVKGVINANRHLATLKHYISMVPGLENRVMKRDDTVKTVTVFHLIKRASQFDG